MSNKKIEKPKISPEDVKLIEDKVGDNPKEIERCKETLAIVDHMNSLLDDPRLESGNKTISVLGELREYYTIKGIPMTIRYNHKMTKNYSDYKIYFEA